jgi:hypothetical protein
MIKRAKEWLVTLKEPPMSQTVMAAHMVPILKAYVRLEKKLPWKVRLFVAVHGVIPSSYLEGEN